MIQFEGFGKIARLFRDVVITEKIDGTNAAIGIVDLTGQELDGTDYALALIGDTTVGVYAQSRNRIITPDKDNFGFARWVWDNAATLATDLGEGLHFGEWWGSGIQRGYGLEKGEKRFSLFNVKRWHSVGFHTPGMSTVPVLFNGPFDTATVKTILNLLALNGSSASPGFMDPEGIIVYHPAANEMFKVTVLNDEAPKSLVNNAY